MAAKTKIKKLHAYLVIDVLREINDLIDIGSYESPAEPHVGDVITRDDFPGTGMHPFTFEDGPLKWIATGQYVASGVENSDGDANFDFGASRVLNLIAFAMQAEETTKNLVHGAFDLVRASLERNAGTDAEQMIPEVDKIEKHFWSR